jgi:ElaB/YqjD/DUF883 family membrane-anchored ribosome-binding protein
MSVQRDPTVDELRRESERSRASLTSTVVQLREKVSDTADDLKERLSPAHIKEEVKDYVREGSEQFFHSIERKARENPLQALAIGAGIAYPLWGIIKSVPVPLMLIGAGLWLSQQKPGGANGQGQGIAGRISDAGAEGVSRVAESARSAGAAVTAGVETVTDKVRATAHDIRDSVTNLGQAAAGSVADATNTVSAAASDMRDKANELVNKAGELGSQTRNAFEDLVERNPLLVGGVGLAIGAFIAASLPPSNAENRMFGESSDNLKEKARETASQGVENAKNVAAGLVGDVAAAAGREGLDPQGLSSAVQSLTQGARSVVDKGLKTALGGDQSSSPSSSSPSSPSSSSSSAPQSSNSFQSSKS